MKHRRFVVVSTLIMLAIACAVVGLALYTSHSVRASVPSLPDALNNLPSDCQFVLGINVQKIVASPAYAKFHEKQSPQIGNDLAGFIEKTGVDPARDVSYLVAAGRSGGKQVAGVAIVVGRFNKDGITAFIRSKSTPVEMEYGGAPILMVPEGKGVAPSRGIAFLNGKEIAVGDLESMKAVLDVRGKGNKSILVNPVMAPLINSIDSDAMLWFAGDAAGVLAKAPVSTPLGANLSSIRNIVGSFSITDAITGTITATAINADAATKLADVLRGFIALGQMAGDQNPDLKALLGGLAVSQDSAQIRVALNFPMDLLDKLGQAKKLPGQTTGNPKAF
jgi:hypothetical protein